MPLTIWVFRIDSRESCYRCQKRLKTCLGSLLPRSQPRLESYHQKHMIQVNTTFQLKIKEALHIGVPLISHFNTLRYLCTPQEFNFLLVQISLTFFSICIPWNIPTEKGRKVRENMRRPKSIYLLARACENMPCFLLYFCSRRTLPCGLEMTIQQDHEDWWLLFYQLM